MTTAVPGSMPARPPPFPPDSPCSLDQSFPPLPSQNKGSKSQKENTPILQVGMWNIQHFARGSTTENGHMVAKERNFAGAMRNHTNVGLRRRVNLPHREYDFKEGKATVKFTEEEDDLLAATCKLTVIGKFMRIRPSIDKIRADFNKTVALKGGVKIGVYNMHHVY